MSEQLYWKCTWCGEEVASDDVVLAGGYYCHITHQQTGPDVWEPQPCGPVVEVKPSTGEEL